MVQRTGHPGAAGTVPFNEYSGAEILSSADESRLITALFHSAVICSMSILADLPPGKTGLRVAKKIQPTALQTEFFSYM
jgi:hypothetical protein